MDQNMRSWGIFLLLILSVAFMGQTHGPLLRAPAQTVPAPEMPTFPYKSVCSLKTTPFKFNDALDGKSRAIDGKNYPRKNKALFRGIKNDWEINPVTFVRSLVDNTIYYESWAFQLYKKEFLDLNDPYTKASLREYFSLHDMQDKFDKLKSCLDKLPKFKEQEAAHLAAALIDHTLERHQKKNLLESRYLDYASGTNVDFYAVYPENFTSIDKFIGRGEIIFSTLDESAAVGYATSFVTGFKDNSSRALDLNYYNYEKYKSWMHHLYDVDEFIQSGYFASEDIRYLRDISDHHAFVKVVFKGVPIVLVVSTNTSVEMVLDPRYLENASQTEATLYGVIQLCDEGKFCPVPNEVIQKFGNYEDFRLGRRLFKALSEVSYQGKKLQFASKNTTEAQALAPPAVVQKILVTRATYGQRDVTSKAQEFCLDKVKTYCNYKIRQRFVFETSVRDFNEPFEMEWECHPGAQKKKIVIDAPAEDKMVNMSCP